MDGSKWHSIAKTCALLDSIISGATLGLCIGTLAFDKNALPDLIMLTWISFGVMACIEIWFVVLFHRTIQSEAESTVAVRKAKIWMFCNILFFLVIVAGCVVFSLINYAKYRYIFLVSQLVFRIIVVPVAWKFIHEVHHSSSSENNTF